MEARVLARESKPIRNQPAEGDELDPTGAQAKGVIDPMELHRQLPDHVKDMVTRRVMALLDDRGRFEAERLGLPHGD